MGLFGCECTVVFNITEEWSPKIIQRLSGLLPHFKSGGHCFIFNRAVNIYPKAWGLDLYPAEVWGQEPLLLFCSSRTTTLVGLKGRTGGQRVYYQYLRSLAFLGFGLIWEPPSFSSSLFLPLEWKCLTCSYPINVFWKHITCLVLQVDSWGEILPPDESYLEIRPCLI